MGFLKKTFDKFVDGGLNTSGMQNNNLHNNQQTSSQPEVLDELPSLPKLSKRSSPEQNTTAQPAAQMQSQAPVSEQNNQHQHLQQSFAPPEQPGQQQVASQRTESTDLLGNFTSQHTNQSHQQQGQQLSEEDFKPPIENNVHTTDSFKPATEQSSASLELPSLDEDSAVSSQVASSPQQVVSHEKNIKRRVTEQTSKADDDKSLYFAILRARLQDEKNEKEAIAELSSHAAQEVIDRLHSHFQRDVKEESVSEVNTLIKQKMQPLQVLESEWRMLQRETKMLTQRLNEIEGEIKTQTTELLDLINQKVERTEKLKHHEEEHQTVEQHTSSTQTANQTDSAQSKPQVIETHHV